MNYDYFIYFEFLGKKQKIKIQARNEDHAREILRTRLVIVKTEAIKKGTGDPEMDKIFDQLNNILKS